MDEHALSQRLIDADNHYYEPKDAVTRHLDPKWRSRQPVRWLTTPDGRDRVVINDRLVRRIIEPSFAVNSKPGALTKMYRELGNADYGATRDTLEPIRPEYRERDARLKVMDEQGVERIWLFPTLGVTFEQLMNDNPAMTMAVLSSFNRFLDEDWGFAFDDRIYAIPLLSLADVNAAVAELEWVLSRGARIIHLRACPVPGAALGRSYADPQFDPFWSRVNEAGITVAMHSVDTGHGQYCANWGELADPPTHLFSRFHRVTRDGREIRDTLADMILHGLFSRYPRLRVVSVEMGSYWVPFMLKQLKKVRHSRDLYGVTEDPVELFHHHVYVEPYPEEDIAELLEFMRPERVVFGSDWPHPEGTETPADFFGTVKNVSDEALSRIRRDNALELLSEPA